MKKLLNKTILISSSVILLSSFANAENTVCYKQAWDSASTIESIPLDGGKCDSKYSLNDMKKKGWSVLDIKITSQQNKLSYSYVLTNDKQEVTEVVKTKKQDSVKVERKNLSFKPIGIKLDNLKDNKTTIDIGNLIVGQSGIVVHIHDSDKKLIVANAQVIESNDNNSVIKFTEFSDLKQDAIPTSKRKASIGDILVLNYLYTNSLLIAPTQNLFQTVRVNFKYNTFMHSDIFGAKLKAENEPLPTKKIIQDFAINQNLGTIFVVVNQKVYVVDTKTFKVLTNYNIEYDTSKNENLPFYTRIEELEDTQGISLINFFDSNKNLTYEEYYSKLLGL